MRKLRWEIQGEGGCSPLPQRGQLKGHGLGGAEIGGEIREEGRGILDSILNAEELIGYLSWGKGGMGYMISDRNFKIILQLLHKTRVGGKGRTWCVGCLFWRCVHLTFAGPGCQAEIPLPLCRLRCQPVQAPPYKQVLGVLPSLGSLYPLLPAE